MSKNIAYLRVSTDSQDTNNQLLAINYYANINKISITEHIEITISSRKSVEARGLDDLLLKLKAGDLLIVSELSRLGRSIKEISSFIDILINKKINLTCIKENIQIKDGVKDLQSTLLIGVCGTFAEVERQLISMRTKEGLKKAVSNGVKLGKPIGSVLDSRLDEIQAMLNKGFSQRAISRELNISHLSVNHFIRTRNMIKN